MAVEISYNVLLKPVTLKGSSDYLERDGSILSATTDYLERDGNRINIRNFYKNRLERINLKNINVSIDL